MNSIELSRVEIRWLIIGLMTVPFAVFLVGFNLGMYQAQATSKALPVVMEKKPVSKDVIEEPFVQTEMELPPIQQQEEAQPNEPPISMEVVVLQQDKDTEPQHIEQRIKKASILDMEDLSQNLFAVQAGNFSSPENAEKYSHALKNKGVNAKVIGNATKTGKNTYRVVIGIFNDRTNAELAALQQKEEHEIDTYVAKLY